ncbi:glutathione-regulated potassium-efflux system protein KefC [Ideonella sp.]|uniref:glutathione-regulated potassium-efflux system protein KefC n=1 Tax=Ideonella sp. TaxID=1929293 RepID=UPI002B464C49|nr:glutathione-regulated potassium-efflux system protein KefC [Ideonella sp.]HJV69289.1 glutathione-regulated potassium-efflux system protein KefC [Ideonella sp.]
METAHTTSWLLTSLIYLGAAVLAVPLARLAGLGSIIGYLAAGIVIGPWGLKLVTDPQAMLHFAEFGVVLMLFLVGLELEPKRLWALRRPIFGWGTVQTLGSAALMWGAAVALGAEWRLALVASLGLALSSTAIGLGVLAERNLMSTTSGQSVLSVALFQDIAAIPILALVPLLAGARGGGGWSGAVKAVAVIAAIVLGGRLLLRPALRWIAGSRTPEIFTAASLLLVVAIAALMQAVGLSMALGAFLAGVLLAESEYRRELETDLEPFKGLLLGLFFIAVGMSIDFGAVWAHPGLVAGLVVAFLVLKALVLTAMGRWMPIPLAERPVFVILLAQGGEFGFVVFQAAAQAGVIEAETSSLLVAAVALSMLLTPLLLVAADRWCERYRAHRPPTHGLAPINEAQDAPIIIAGFGRYGQIVGRLLFANGLKATVLEHSAEQVESLRRWGWRVFYGDATRLDLLRVAGAGSAKVLVVAVDDMAQSLAVVDLAQAHFPQLTLVVRARNAQHWYELNRRGVTHIERETFDAALMSGRSVLETLGFEPHQARTLAWKFRRHSIEQLHELAPHYGDQARLIALSKAGRQQLEDMFAQDRALRSERPGGAGWHADDAEEASAPSPR